jgi:uncharacterized repeat protein (TIGR03803 family)
MGRFSILAFLFGVLLSSTAFAADTVIHNFGDVPDGFSPDAGLIADSNGALYGTTRYGGAGNCSLVFPATVIGCGTVFKLTPPVAGQTAWTKTLLYSFTDGGDGNGSANLLLDSSGVLYGVSSGFLPHPTSGSIYKLTPGAPNAPWTKQTLYAVPACHFGSCIDGFFPAGGLVQDANGTLYGVMQAGGTHVHGTSWKGTIFSLTPPAPGQTSWTQTAIYNFCGLPKCADGRRPMAQLIMDSSGALYGTTANGGNGNDKGTIFKLTPPPAPGGAWTMTTLYRFCGVMGCPDGQNPAASLVMGADGTLYGIASGGGAKKHGTIFSLTPAAGGAWTYNVLHHFCTAKNCSDGGNLTYSSGQGLIMDATGALYGMAPYNGASKAGCAGADSTALGTIAKRRCGTVFQLAPSPGGWNYTVLHDFGLSPSDGHWPTGALAFGPGGTLYGMTPFGGSGGVCPQPWHSGGCGVVFSIP